MMVLGLFLSLALQDDRVAERIRSLDHDNVEVRDKASAELAALEETARGPLEQALSQTSAPEAKARIQSLLARLDQARRRKDFDGGKIVDDLGPKLRIEYDNAARKLSVTFDVTNLGTTERPMVELRSWSQRLPSSSSSSSSAEGCLTIEQLTGETSTCHSSRFGCGPRPLRNPFMLRPAQTATFKRTFDVSSLNPGEHQVQVSFFQSALGSSSDLVSNTLQFTVQ